MSKRDYYDVLGLAKNASDDDIKLAYRRMASKYHPDKFEDEKEKEEVEVKFKEAKEAYEALSDSVKRAEYDAYGHTDENTFAHAKSRASSARNQRVWTFEQSEDMHEVFNELFKRHAGFANHGAAARITINISLRDAYTGRTVKHEENTIVIPKGTRPGTSLYVGGKIYKIDVIQHDKFKRALDDLMTEVSISAIEAMLGVEAVLEHLDGNKLQFTIPSGIQNGQIVKLSRTGMPNPETGHIGDMLVRINITIPKDLSDADKAQLKNISHRMSISI